ncbi:putative ORFan [Tupanvirus deep ocean]|uniref:ORFan n=2 Tax=Tupanvirus TaxID=2094720 RepID=A0AC62A9U8_9VIRU|nr:putative ORFan [Tupanvirus deep ocean]QKU34452.1 putative ORFan [Tupanvirus deep ocean]
MSPCVWTVYLVIKLLRLAISLVGVHLHSTTFLSESLSSDLSESLSDLYESLSSSS